jgi:hypothetical protein
MATEASVIRQENAGPTNEEGSALLVGRKLLALPDVPRRSQAKRVALRVIASKLRLANGAVSRLTTSWRYER